MDKNVLKAESRKIVGRKVKNLRKQGLLPANVSGNKVKSLALQLPLSDFEEIYKEVGETGLIDLHVGSETKPVLVHNVQKHALTDEVIHVDFLQVDLKVKVEADVPVEVVGESPAEKQALGTVVQHLNTIKVEALPMDLPEKFEVSIESLAEVDQAIHVKDLKYDKAKVEVKTNEEEIVVKVEPPQKEEVIEAPVPAEGEVPAEGAVPAEGENAQEASEQKEEPKA